MTGPGAATLNEIIAAIKFQFTGETVVQGFPGEGEFEFREGGDEGVSTKLRPEAQANGLWVEGRGY